MSEEKKENCLEIRVIRERNYRIAPVNGVQCSITPGRSVLCECFIELNPVPSVYEVNTTGTEGPQMTAMGTGERRVPIGLLMEPVSAFYIGQQLITIAKDMGFSPDIRAEEEEKHERQS